MAKDMKQILKSLKDAETSLLVETVKKASKSKLNEGILGGMTAIGSAMVSKLSDPSMSGITAATNKFFENEGFEEDDLDESKECDDEEKLDESEEDEDLDEAKKKADDDMDDAHEKVMEALQGYRNKKHILTSLIKKF